jgi:type II secretory pathway pseudopilin PulG
MKRVSAYTLIEILVVVGVFSLLGSILVALLHGSIRTWRGGESTRQAFEKAGVALDQIRDDLSAVYTVEAPGTFSPSKPVEIRVLCRYVQDSEQIGTYKQELALVRTIPQRLKNLTAALGGNPGKFPGNLVDDDGDNSARQSDKKDNDGDAWVLRNNGKDDDGDEEIDEQDEGTDEPDEGIDEEFYNLEDDDKDGQIDEDLRPLGDLMQVRYAWRGATLYRGFQAPLDASRDPLDPDRDLAADPERFSIAATPVTALVTGVLYFGVRFWTPDTTDWDAAPGNKDKGGPEEIWDSTRGLTLGKRPVPIAKGEEPAPWQLAALDERSPAKRSAQFYYYRSATEGITSYNYRPPVLAEDEYDTFFDPSDDVFPSRVQVTLVLTNTRGTRRAVFLKQDLSGASGSIINVDDTAVFRGDSYPYVKIDGEWIRYSHIADEHTLVIAQDGRGARGTLPAEHKAGTDVETGTTFVLTVDIPSYREVKE